MTTELWDDLHVQNRHQLRYPSEDVVRFLVAASWQDGYGDPSLLDIGCGAGRHMKLAAELDWRVTGVDMSDPAVEQASQYGPTVCAPMTDLPFPDGSFDAALSFGVFFYGDWQTMVDSVYEMHRILRPGGFGFINVRSTKDWRFGRGEKLSLNVYRFQMDGEPEDGMILNFLQPTQIPHVYGGFDKLRWEWSEWTRGNRTLRNSDWLITVQK